MNFVHFRTKSWILKLKDDFRPFAFPNAVFRTFWIVFRNFALLERENPCITSFLYEFDCFLHTGTPNNEFSLLGVGRCFSISFLRGRL